MIGGICLSIAFGLLAMAAACAMKWPRVWLGAMLVGCGVALTAALVVLTGGTSLDWHGSMTIGGELPHLRLDAIGAWFLALIAIVGGAGAAYARGYWWDDDYPHSASRGRLWWSALVLSMALIVTLSNGLHFLIAWELFAVSAYLLITLENRKPEVRKAGWLYLAASHAGTISLFAFFSTLAARTGSWDLGPLLDRQDLAPLFWLALFGFGVKAGIFSLHVWLPSAHANAPSHVSAILSGVAIKMGIYGIIRFSGWLPVPAAAGWVVITIGALGALFGIAFAFAQNDYKRLLAYCSVENIGIILTGVGASLLARSHGDAPWGQLALAGALLHVWNHGAFKTLLFFGAGSVLHATGTREMTRLGGLWKAMPWTAICFALGCVAVSALPPLNGFVSEWLIYMGLFEASMAKSHAAWAAMPAAILLAMAGALALATFIKAGTVMFLGAPRTQVAEKAHECGPWMRWPMLLIGGLCLFVGLAPALFWPLVLRVVDTWHSAPAEVPATAPLNGIGVAHAILAILIAAGGLWLWRKSRINSLRRGPTWDCGYARPAARMQYSSGSFAEIANAWFGWLLRPLRQLRRPRGLFPATSMRLVQVPDTVLEKILTPLAEAILWLSTAVRRLQHGRLQSYIFYVLVGLTLMGAFVLLGGNP